MFEPTRVVGLGLEEADSSSSSDVEDSGLPTALNRLVNTSWCLCSRAFHIDTSNYGRVHMLYTRALLGSGRDTLSVSSHYMYTPLFEER